MLTFIKDRMAPAGLLGIALAAVVLHLIATDSAAAGAPSEATVFAERCATCHGSQLQGGRGPALTGEAFYAEWQGQSLRKLYGRIMQTMPADDPGSLATADAISVVSYIAKKNAVDLGKTPPSTVEALAQYFFGSAAR